MTHFHVASGLTGYGRDAGNTTYRTATTAPELADEIRAELDDWAEAEAHSAGAYADAEDYKAAWLLNKHANEIEVTRANFANSRQDVLGSDRWHETILRTVRESFPYDVNEGRSRVYAWECTEPDDKCEHLNDDD